MTTELGRRGFIVALGAAALAPAAASAADAARIPVSQAFRFLDSYLGLPPAQRSLFRIGYRVVQGTAPAPGLKVMIVGPAGQRPLLLDAHGDVAALPTLAEFKSSAVLQADTPFHIGLYIGPDVAPATRLDAVALNQALVQANAAIVKLAGVMAAMAPKLNATLFLDAGGGAALGADGRSTPLPITTAIKQIGPTPYLASANAAARWVTLTRAPSRILFAKA